MPLIRIDHLENQTQLALWSMEESEEEWLSRYPYMAGQLVNIKSETRRKEHLTACGLLEALTGCKQPNIRHDEAGKPYTDCGSISISHTRGYCAMLFSPNKDQRLGIDIEWMSQRVERITSYFMREDEKAPTLIDKLLNWSAKETCYKYFSEQDLKYSEMRVSRGDDHSLEVENLKAKKTLNVGFFVDEKFVLTWSRMCSFSKKIS
ncbi:MAG: 4'-phosphopantetheinyl transferase family protein [Prevotella sp.]|jgi:4'-phosphopantetheinyl transferase EntD